MFPDLQLRFAITKQIDETIKRFFFFQSSQMTSDASPILKPSATPIFPEQPWSRMHMDFVGPINDLNLLLVVDAHSKWLEIFPMQKANTRSTITILRWPLGQHGLQQALVSDTEWQFTSERFHHFFRSCYIVRIRSPPNYLQSNGQAERFADPFKRGLLKAKG